MGSFGLVLFVFLSGVESITARGVNAQSATSTVSIEAGAIRIRQNNRRALVSPVLTLSARRAAARAAVSGSALLVQSGDNAAASQLTLGGEFMAPGLQSLRLETSGSATFFDAPVGNRETSTSGILRTHFVRDRYGAFGTVGSGVTQRGATKFHAVKWDVGTWARRGRFSLSAALRQSYTRDYPLIEASEFVLTDSVMYSVRDFEGTVAAQFRAVQLQATAAWRDGFGATVGHTNAVALAAVVHLNSRLALSLNGGKQLAEWLTGVPSARVFGASLRFNLIGASPAKAQNKSNQPVGANASPFAAQVERHTGGGATVRVRIDAPESARVELSGSFNDWTVVTVTRTDGRFQHVLELPAGTHRVAIRINGGEWKAPEGLARVKDDLGGEAGLVVVP